jgi:branched-chain amino acid aminotransferase
MDGQMVPWEDAKIHVLSHVVHYGTSWFEGIRAYRTAKGTAIFRLEEHLHRLGQSLKIYHSELPYSVEELAEVCKRVIRENGLDSCYLRPVAFRGYHELGLYPLRCPLHVAVAAWEWGRYLGEDALESGVDVGVSSWSRMYPNTLPTASKAGGNYMNAQLIRIEAMNNGYSEGIALSPQGYVSEGSGENIFMVFDGKLYTPPFGASILPGITRATVIILAKEAGYEVVEEQIPRGMLYTAEEIFFTGTAAEITPVRSVDKITIGAGKPGPFTREIQRRFFDVIHNGNDPHGWLSFV